MEKEKTTLPAKLKDELAKSNLTDLTKAEKIASGYAPFMNQVSDQMQILKKLKKGKEEDLPMAKRVRIDLGSICSKVADKKKIDKDYLLIETRFIDNLYNVVNGAARITQGEAKELETYFERIEAERIETLQNERVEECRPFVQNELEILSNLGTLPDAIWNNYITGLETSFNARKAAEKKAEEERIEAERINKLYFKRYNELAPFQEFTTNIIDYNLCEFGLLSEKEYSDIKTKILKAKSDYETEQEKIRLENERLKKEAEVKAKQAEKERIERERLAAIETKKAAELKAKQYAIIAKQKADSEAKLKAEKEKADKLAAELKAKQDAELAEKKRLNKLAADKLESEKQAALAPEKDKITSWIDSFNINEIDSDEFSIGAQATVNIIKQKFEGFKKWAISQK